MLPWNRHRPSYLIYYVTSKCNLRCRHCFYLEELNQHDDLTLDEVQRVAEKAAPLDFVRLTGGEPFIRKDLPEVIEAFHKRAGVGRMGLISNATLPDRMVAAVREIFARSPELTLDLGVSIDGLADVHDDLRGRKGLFDTARKAVHELVALQPELPGLMTSLVITISKRNLSTLNELYDEVSGWGVDRLSVNMVRGRIAGPDLKDVPFETYCAFAERLERYHQAHQRGLKPAAQRAKNRLTRKAIQEVMNGHHNDIPCLAADAICVLYSDGIVSVCETLDEDADEELIQDGKPVNSLLGNVRDTNYDLHNILESEAAERARKWIRKTNCSCTHECFLTASILWGGLSTVPSLIRETISAR